MDPRLLVSPFSNSLLSEVYVDLMQLSYWSTFTQLQVNALPEASMRNRLQYMRQFEQLQRVITHGEVLEYLRLLGKNTTDGEHLNS
jgi:hypothetical protein